MVIDTYVKNHKEKFNDQTSLFIAVRHEREWADEGYNKAVILTDKSGRKVAGALDDGQVMYKWPWVTPAGSIDIGPWDCDVASPLEAGNKMTPEECCAKIQADVTEPDILGNYLECFVEEPVGSDTGKNPNREDRAIVVVNSENVVVRAPIHH